MKKTYKKKKKKIRHFKSVVYSSARGNVNSNNQCHWYGPLVLDSLSRSGLWRAHPFISN